VKWISLFSYKEPALYRGTRIRFPADYPYEDVVEFMVYDNPDSPGGFGLVVTSGYKAGLIDVHLPVEANIGVNVHAISAAWLKTNFRKWVWNVSSKTVFVSMTQNPMPRLPKISRK
jgi:Immunity protein 45